LRSTARRTLGNAPIRDLPAPILIAEAVVVAASVAAFIFIAGVVCDQRSPTCAAGRIAALFTNCEVFQ
jgi:hypothetical protein